MSEPTGSAVERLRARAAARAAEAEAIAAAAPRGRARSRPARWRTAPAALTAAVLLAVGAGALAAATAARLDHRSSVNAARSDALAAASTGVATVLSYDYRSLAHDFAVSESLLTPTFRKQYVATTGKAVEPLAAKYHAVSTAEVTAAGIVQASGSRAVVLVLVNQTVTNTQLAAPRLDRSRIDVVLVKRAGRWLIDRLNPI